jgi:hypothetical protein
MYFRIGKWYAGDGAGLYEEQERCQADALAGDERAIRYWTEFVRLRMTG